MKSNKIIYIYYMLKKLFGKLAGNEAAAAASTARFVIFLKHCGRLVPAGARIL